MAIVLHSASQSAGVQRQVGGTTMDLGVAAKYLSAQTRCTAKAGANLGAGVACRRTTIKPVPWWVKSAQ